MLRRITLKNFIRSLVIFLCASLASTFAAANTDAPINKIGVLDWQQLLSKAPQAEEAAKRLEKEFQGPQKKLIEKQKEFQAKREKLQRDKDVMSATDRAKKEKDLQKMQTDLQRQDEEYRSDYSSRQRDEMDGFITLVRGEVEKLAQEKKFDLIIPQEATLYIADRIDITEMVLERLEKAAKNTKSSGGKKAEDKEEKKSES